MSEIPFIANFKVDEETLSQDLISLNREGFLVGPNEEKPAFFARVDRDGEKGGYTFPEELAQIFDVRPNHLEVIYSDEGIGGWEGGCTWIESSGVSIQLRKKFLKSSKLFFLYSRKEVLMHEAVHAVRMKFHEPLFEEILAYRTSRGLRRYLGPLFRHPGESYWSIFGALVGLGISSYDLVAGLLVAIAVPIYFLSRLIFYLRIFAKAQKKIRKLLGIPPLWVLLRLTDAEIKFVASQPLRIIEEYAKKKKLKDLRWRQIYASYFM
ncbi:hypothetical protein [Chlamydiifrater phoenicopteri]|uniref:hypothetical protein n=1 Tax=Chlamydiifrater phoenicopteri TaxID=2681469 RepID=UPI001BCC0040|nr:hypothetical protein [Chlamydiifrater phoenicopteri]